MTDERLLAAFAQLDRSVTPDAAFGERLFEALAADLDFRELRSPAGRDRARPRMPLRQRIARRLGVWPMATGTPALRIAWTIALVGLLLAGALATALVAYRLLAHPAPDELVRMSREAWAHPPAVQFTITDLQGTTTVAGDGHGTWRSASWDAAPGAYLLYDGERTGQFDVDRQTWVVAPLESGGAPYPFNSPFAWTDQVFPDLIAKKVDVPCDGATDLGEATVAGRAADHIGCPDLGLEYWLDRSTHLTLRMLAREGTRYWQGPEGAATVIEVTLFSAYEPDTALFSWSGPAGARPAEAPVASSLLAVGVRPPAWYGETVAGRYVSGSSIDGAAAVLFVRPTSGSRMGEALDGLVAAARNHPSVTMVAVGSDLTGTIVAYLAQHGAAFDPVIDADMALYDAWGIRATPALVLLGRDGRVAGMAAGRLTGADVEAMVAALEQGRPIPAAAAASPGPTPALVHPTPGPGIVCDGSTTTCLPTGATVPAWSGHLLGGGTIAGGSLAGRPVVVLFCTPCESSPDILAEAARLVGDYAPRAAFVLVGGGETTPGDSAAALRAAGVTAPLVLDLDNAVSVAFSQVVGGYVVLDSQGRIAAQPPGGADTGPVRAALDALLPPPPSPVASIAPTPSQ